MTIQHGAARRTRAVSALILLAAASSVSGCSSNGLPEHNVLVINGELSVTETAHTDELVDINVPLKNDSSHAVHIESIGLPPTKNVRQLGTAAYNVLHAGSDFIVNLGDLPKECPKQYPAHAPVTAVTLPPHQQPLWFGVVTVVFAKPGKYDIPKVKIFYRTDGHRAWQYQDTLLRVTVKNPPRPGPKPVPSSDACQ